MHIISLSFDDGLLQSTLKTAELHEKYGLSACFNIVATGEDPSFVWPTTGKGGPPLGDFPLWNELKARGHEIMPHGYKHANKRELPFAESKRLITANLEIFEKQIKGFDAQKAVFNFPYNASTPELETWLPTVMRAFRTLGTGFNPLPTRELVRLTTTGHGPENCEQHLDQHIDTLLKQPNGWLLYTLHGLDDEGWGPISADYLDRLLAKLTAIPMVKVLPTGRALELYG